MKTLLSISIFFVLSLSAKAQTSYETYINYPKASAKSLIYPNPTHDSFSIKNDTKVSEISVFNIIGKLVLSETHVQGVSHNVSELKKGIYLVRLLDEDDEIIKVIRLTKK